MALSLTSALGGAAAWARKEFLLLLVLLLASSGLLGFTILASEVSEGETHAFDEALLLALRTSGNTSDPIGPRWVEAVFRDVTSLGGPTVITLITGLTVGYLLLARRYGTAFLVLAAIGSGALVSFVLKDTMDRPRPDLVSHLVDVQTASFPSGHATLSAVVYLTIGALLAREQPSRGLRFYVMVVAILATVLIGCSRVYLGVHWPTDVLAGWAIGSAWAMLWWIAAWVGMARHRAAEPEPGR